MRRLHGRSLAFPLIFMSCRGGAFAQTALSWEEVRERFRQNNPALLAGQAFIEESKAGEVTAGLRPNPQLSFIADQFRVFNPNPLVPFQNTQITPVLSQLFERRNKRHLRISSARFATSIAATDLADQERQLTFNLRDAFNRILQAKSLLQLAQENLAYYDRVIAVNRERYRAGDISQVDLMRVELQRVQFESDLLNAQVNVRTAKIGLLSLMNERQPVDSFDIRGDFSFKENILLMDELRQMALDSRPDLQSASTAVEKARTDHQLAWANGSTDPDVSFEYQRTQQDNTAGIGVTIPIRIFDRNQGEKARSSIEMRRSAHLRQNIVAGIYRDVDSAAASVQSTLNILKPYRDKYLKEAESIRDTVSFAYSRGAASLLEFLDAQKSYRDIELNYRNLIGGYLSSVNQLNLAVGREVIP